MQEKKIILNKFLPREYQLPIMDAILNKGYKRVIVNACRRSGKDITAWNIAIRQCLLKTCLVYYCLPTFSQAKRTIFDAITIDGMKFLDFIPREVIESINTQEMKIRFKNDSILQLIGGDTYNTSLVGTNPYGLVLSEFALMDPQAYEFARPILAANNGWCLILSTPRGHNWFFDKWKFAQTQNDWFCYQLTVHQTNHISAEALDRERLSMSPELFSQEFEVSFDKGVEGSYYAKYLDALRRNNKITNIEWDPSLPVVTSWDLGVSDQTCIVFYQIAQQSNVIRIIDCYANSNVGLDHYVKILKDKPYVYSHHLGPSDLAVREWAGGAMTRLEKARNLGIDFTVVPHLSIDDGIEAVWTNFNKFLIDENRCKPLIYALENYRREWDEQKQRYKDHPLHDKNSNFADSLRYGMIGLPIISTTDYTAEDLNKRYQRVMNGGYNNSSVFGKI